MKIAISIPDSLFEKTERYTAERGLARSQVVAEALTEYLAKRDDESITAKLNEVYGSESSELDPALRIAQFASVDDEAW